MKKLPAMLLAATLAGGGSAAAASLMLDFGATAVAAPYEALSPGHAAGAIPAAETAWNTINTSANRTDLVFGNGTTAAGITLDLGQEATGGSNVIDFATSVSNLALAGTGGAVPGQQSLLGTGSIYGDNTSSTAAARDGFFGGGTATGTGAAIGLRLDGLAAGTYRVDVVARNTNSNAASLPMNVYVTTGATAGTFNFSPLTATAVSNPGYPSSTYAGEYNTFVAGENFASFEVVLAAGESLFLAVDGGSSATERRGFLNSVQLANVPEPSAALLGMLGLLPWLRRRR